VSRSAASSAPGKIGYGLLFIVVLPLALALWASLLDRSLHWPVPYLPAAALALAVCGGLLMLQGMLDLRIHGHGLPMNAYPPTTFVTRGSYRWFAHPIYVGAVCVALGCALWLRSGSGLYIVTPLLVCMILSLLFGLEIPATAARFGEALAQHRPRFSLPAPSDEGASGLDRLAMVSRVFVPWILAAALLAYARGARTVGGTPDSPWATGAGLLAMTPMLLVIGALLTARTHAALRHAVIIGTVATSLALYLDVVLPALVPRSMGTPWSAAIIHLVAVVSGFAARRIWRWMLHATERVANSRRDWLFAGGRFRIINHSVYSAAAGALGVGIVASVTAHPAAAVVIQLCVVAGAALFAQASWGSRSLLRPFGYWGGVLGSVAGVGIAQLAFGIPLARIAVAIALSATFVQAVGRLRCLAQGCCHGVPAKDADAGIRVWQPQSRVVVLSRLAGVSLLDTQLYSIVFNLALGPLLWSLWLGGVMSEWMVVGLYFILTGLERFAEDAYRGETQTRMLRGLRENQWIALAALAGGMILAALSGSPASPGVGTFDAAWLGAVLVGGATSGFALSMDFPKSSRRFSRLSG
jgi:protein-S-isoprenylcysteine O-methyltransferase Ste14